MRPNTPAPAAEDQTFIEAARRRQIIDCAIQTIAALGYERASLAEIAKCAGISKGNLAYYFASKDGLMDAVVVDVYARAYDYMLPKLQAQTTVAATLRALIVTNIEFIRDHRQAVQAITEIISSSRGADGRPRFDVRGQDQPIAEIEQVLKWGQAEGEFRAFAPSVYAFAIRTSIDALGPRLLVQPDLDLDQYAKEMADMFLRAVVKNPVSKEKKQ